MMIIDDQFALNALILANAVLLAAVAMAILRLERQRAAAAAFWETPVGASLKAEGDNAEMRRIFEARFAHLEELLEKLSADETANASSRDALPYRNAVRMVRHGAGIDDLTRNCGLSVSEARLLMRVHAGRIEDAA